MAAKAQVDTISPADRMPPRSPDGFQPLDIRSIKFNRVSWLIFAAMVFAGVSIGATITYFANPDGHWISLLVAAAGLALVVIILFFALKWPRLEYDHTHWRLDEIGLQIHRGVVWRENISIPIARVQHADVSQGPLQRSYGLGTLTIHTAGTQNASILIAGLAYETALEVRDKIVAQRKSGHVV